MASGNTLVNEIYDQFLVCKVCLEAYKNPKTLTCQHTFCRDCLAKHHESEQERGGGRGYRFQTHRSLSCPVCRKRMDLPLGGISKLSDNFLVSNLCEVVERRRTNRPRSTVTDCDICRPKQTVAAAAAGTRTRPAATKDASQAHFRCLDCAKTLCRRCADLHRRTKVTQEHGIFDIDVQDRSILCRMHKDETIRFYCEPCEVCICVLCTFQDHKDHEVYTFSEGIERHGHTLDTLLERSRGRCGRLRDQINLIGSCEAGIRTAEEYIRETAMDWVRQIRQQERQILRDLEELANEKAREFIQQKTALQETLEALESTCNLTEIIIRDRSVELLLLKDEINAKLNKLLAEGKIFSLPDIITRRVAFVPGNPCFLGRLDFLEPYAGGVPPQSTKTKRTEESNVDDLHSSCVDRRAEEESRTPAGNESSNPIDQRKPNLLHSDEHPNPLNIPSMETLTVGSKTCRTIEGSGRGKSKSVARPAFQSRDMWCQRNNSNSCGCSDRSGTTTRELGSQCSDQVLDTEGQVRTRDGSTQSTEAEAKSVGKETDRIVQADKSMLTNSPTHVNKFVMTQQPCLRSTQTNTAGIVMLDMAVTAKIVGDHKATSTKPLLTVDQSTFTAPETIDDKRISRLSNERSDNRTEFLSENPELLKHRAYLESSSICSRKVSPTGMCLEAADVQLCRRMTDAFVQMSPEMHDSCVNTTLTAVDSVHGCSKMSFLFREIGTNASFLQANGLVIPRTAIETADKATNTSMILPLSEKISTNSPILEDKYEGSFHNLPATVEIGTSTAILEEKIEGSCQRLPCTAEIGTNTPTVEEKNEVASKNRPQTLPIRKIEHIVGTAGNAGESLKDRSVWSTSLTFRSHSIASEAINMTPISKDVSTNFQGVAKTGDPPVQDHDVAPRRRQTRVTVTRGTSTTSRTTMTEKETSTDDLPMTRKGCTIVVDRGCSPVRFSSIDKAVSASRGEIAEPVDKFQAPGKPSKLLQTITAGPKLDAICEDSNESSSDEEGQAGSRQMVLPSAQRQRQPGGGKGGLLTHRERFAPSFGGGGGPSRLQGGRPTNSTFSVEGRTSACSILWKVEMGTNTSSVQFEDKSVGTDSPTVDSKMAECINKLKTVSLRLETKQTTAAGTSAITNSSCSSSTSRESGEMTMSSTSEIMTVERPPSSSSTQSLTRSFPEQSEQTMKLPKRDRMAFHSRVGQPKQRRSYPTAAAAGPDSPSSESSDQEQSGLVAAAERRPAWKHGPTLARKKRFDMNEMLKSSPTAVAASKTRSPRIGRKPSAP